MRPLEVLNSIQGMAFFVGAHPRGRWAWNTPCKTSPTGGGLLQKPKAAFKPEPDPNSYSLLGLWVWIYLKKKPAQGGLWFFGGAP
jgi:hypothetical protein